MLSEFSTPQGNAMGAPSLKVITGADPAAGAEISETVPVGRAWEVLSVRFTLVTDVTVANRNVFLELVDDASNIFFKSFASAVTTASRTEVFTGAQVNLATRDSANNENHLLPLPAGAVLPAGFIVRTATRGLQAGDDLSAPVLYVVEYQLG